jgi:hypothetical protein
LGVTVSVLVNARVGVTVGVDVAASWVGVWVWVAEGVSVVVTVVVGVPVGVCASAVHKPNAAKRREAAAADRSLFEQTRISRDAKPFAGIMDPSGGSTRVHAMERVDGRR